MANGNICHIKVPKRIVFALIVFMCFSYYGTAQKDNIPLFYLSGGLRQYLDTNFALKDTNKCLLIHFNRQTKQFKICHISPNVLGLYLHAEYDTDSLFGMAVAKGCLCFLFGDNCPMFHKTKDYISLPAFFYEQLQYKDHRLCDFRGVTEPPVSPRYFVTLFKKRGDKLIYLCEKEIYIDIDYFIYLRE